MVNHFRLQETLEVYVDQYTQGELPPEFANRFPESITVGQVVSTWKEIIKYQHNSDTEV